MFVKKNLFFLTISCFIAVLFAACSADYTPKPRAYPRIIFPEHSYKKFDNNDCPFTFEQPVYTKIGKAKKLIAKANSDCWVNLEYDYFNAQMHFSYSEIGNETEALAKLVNDSYKLSFKHVVKADYIEDSLMRVKDGLSGVFYNVGGDAASSTQFFLTDSTKHFLWASLYLHSPPNEDSIAPVIRFIRKDIEKMIQTFEWTN
jgi:gliding motility-associated lipoprotein GldD